ncbi:hypothetical protein MAZ19_002607 [Escherichia coli]|nr:hypothetical protein [Escherichia coli]EJW0404751.1 hypothetical protein [Escherichia coli]
MKLPVKLLMSLISLVSVIARAGEYKNYSRDEKNTGDIHHTRGGNFRKVSLMRKFPAPFTTEEYLQ